MSTEDLLLKSLGDKPFCSRKQLIRICIDAGLCNSISGAIGALKSLPWMQVSEKRKVVTRKVALDYLNKYSDLCRDEH